LERELRVVEDVAAEAVHVFLETGPRTVLLSGGTTPREFYRRLAGLDYPWDDVELFLGDERCVPEGDERSNARMVREALAARTGARLLQIDGARCDADGYERLLRERFGERIWFDLAVYGLGPDGHTASLFPGRPEVEVADRWVVRVPEAGFEPFVARVSLTLPALSAAPVGMFLVEGEAKREAVRRLLAGEQIPAARVQPLRLLVLADPAAAGPRDRVRTR
jgi:6-phosphogluconolactonase